MTTEPAFRQLIEVETFPVHISVVDGGVSISRVLDACSRPARLARSNWRRVRSGSDHVIFGRHLNFHKHCAGIVRHSCAHARTIKIKHQLFNET